MPKKRKTKEEKVRSSYRLGNFRLREEEQREKKDAREFGYLSKDHVGKDLGKTLLFSALIVGLLVIAKKYLTN